MKRWCSFGVFVLLAAGTAQAADTVKLEWKFKEGDKFYVETVTETTQTIGSMGKQRDVKKTVTAVSSYRVLKKSKDGLVMELKFESMKVKGNDPLGALAGKFSEGLKEIDFKVTVDAKGKVTKFEGFDEYLKKIVGDNEAALKMARTLKLDVTMKEGIDMVFGFVPDKPVGKGDKWKRQAMLTFGALGGFKVESHYVYQGKLKEGEEIAFTSTLTYEVPEASDDLPIKIKKGNFKTKEGKGTLIFDSAAGRLVRMEKAVNFKGSVTVETLGNEQINKLEQKSVVKMRVLDKPPSK
jgi:hypothetical protein